jgi:MscS family membrane protein
MNFLDQLFLNNLIGNWLIVAIIILVVAIGKRFLSRYIAALLFIPIQKKWKSVEKIVFVDLVFKPLGIFLAVFVSFLAISSLHYPALLKFAIGEFEFHELLLIFSKCVIIIYFIAFARRCIDFIALVLDINAKSNKDKRDDQLIVFFRDFIKAVLYIIGGLLILKLAFKVNVGAVLTGLSIVGAALALAAKESIENLIASFIIFFDKPFFTGDLVKVNNQNNTAGTIEQIGLRSTRIRTNDHTLITVPNKQMVDSVLDNWSMRDARRSETKIELDINSSSAAIVLLMDEIQSYLENTKPTIVRYSVFVTDYTKSSITITIEFFTQPIELDLFQTTKQQFLFYAKESLEKHQFKLATSGHDINIINSETGFGNPNIDTQII